MTYLPPNQQRQSTEGVFYAVSRNDTAVTNYNVDAGQPIVIILDKDMLLTVILIIISFSSPTHSFIPGLIPSFSAHPSHCTAGLTT